tara:strand:- start:1677 stop:2591 length:915 start_codon:yes stop_codon:yes gene_type:complete
MNKNNLVVLAAAGRTGTNYVMNTITSDKTYYMLGEFFNHIPWNIVWHTDLLAKMLEKNSPYVFEYKDWFKELSLCYKRNGRTVFSENGNLLQKDMRRFIKISNLPLFENCINFINYELNLNSVHKTFLFHTSLIDTPENDIDLETLLKHCNNLVVVYRNNILEQYISEQKANITNLWYIGGNIVNTETYKIRIKKSQELKLQWDKSNYVERHKQIEGYYKILLEIYKNYNGNKCQIEYDELHSQKNKLEYLQEIYNKNNIDVTINTDNYKPAIKLAKDQPLEDNFSNSEEFLKDLPSIPIFFKS